MTLISFYKTTIKENSQKIKESKQEIKNLMRSSSAVDKKLWELKSSQLEIRFLYHLYASLRGQDLSKIESNPRVEITPEDLKALSTRMEKNFHQLSKEKELA